MNERIKELARQAGFNDFPNDVNGIWITDGYWDEQLERFAELVRQDEREACAKLCEDLFMSDGSWCAKSIRSRDMSTKPENIDTSEERVKETDKSIHEEIERLKAEIKRLQDLAEYRLKLLMQMPENKPWVGLTDEEIKGILDCGRGGLVDIKKAEQILKERNNG